jgi:hypothetical protein
MKILKSDEKGSRFPPPESSRKLMMNQDYGMNLRTIFFLIRVMLIVIVSVQHHELS